MLDAKFFRHHALAAKYAAYECVYGRATMVLFSKKTHTPLAAITLVSSTPQVTTLLTARQAPTDDAAGNNSYFQGMLNRDEAPFSFAVSNLCQDGHLSFNIFAGDSELPINEVNGLKSGETYPIPCDQRTGRAMTIKAQQKEGGVATTLREAEEKKAKEGGKGSMQFKVVIAPEVNHNVKWFEEGTFWQCVPGFVRPAKPNPKPSRWTPHWARGGGEEEKDGEEIVAMSNGLLETFSPPVYRNCGMSRGGELRRKKKSAPPRYAAEPQMYRSLELGGIEKGMAKKAEDEDEDIDIGGTTAVDMNYTGNKIHVETTQLEMDFDMTQASAPMIICLSLWQNMKLRPGSDIQAFLRSQVQDLTENEGKRLLASLPKIFKSEICVIDLESPANAVILQCGHQCVNIKYCDQLKECPVCRGTIMACVLAQDLIK